MDRYDIIAFLAWTGFLAFTGLDGRELWGCMYGWLVAQYFAKEAIDRWLDQKFPMLKE